MPETLVYIDAAGTTHNLGCPDCPVDGLAGRFMPPTVLTVDTTPGVDGGSLRSVRLDVRPITVPVAIKGSGEAGTRTALRAFVKALNPHLGSGRLRNTAVDGIIREIDALYDSGLSVDERHGQTRSPDVQMAVIVFRALDPFWRDTADTTHSFSAASVATFFPFFPLVLLSGEILSSETVTNNGDVEAWPVWTITGPANGVTLINNTTGARLGISTTLGSGDVVTIDTRPGYKTITGPGPTNLLGDLTADRDLWSLAAGANAITIQADGLDPLVTAASVAYRQRYLSP